MRRTREHRPRRQGSGWTVAEMLVVCILSSVIFLVLTDALRGTLRITTLQNQKAGMQAELQGISTELLGLAQRCTPEDIAIQLYAPPPASVPAVVAFHCLAEGPCGGSPTWEAKYRVYIWDYSTLKLRYVECPPGPPSPAPPSTTQCQLASAADLAGVALSPPGSRLVGEGVTNFTVGILSGPLVHVSLELERPVPGRTTFDKHRVERDVTLRNPSN